MRVKCQIEIVNRNVASHGMRGGCGKFAQAALFLARKPGDLVFLIYCTSKDKQGVKYKVKKNIQHIFGKFVDEGKCTIRILDPSIDVCIKKANPIDLKRLLGAIKLANSGQSLSGHGILSSMEPAKAKQLEKPKLKLIITSRKNYPTTTSFPLSLEKLEIHDCNLARVDTRIFHLKRLTTLNLSSNKIKLIPIELLNLPLLGDLDISNNEITEFPMQLCEQTSNFCKNLSSLNLSNNKIAFLPPNFDHLSELWQLNIGKNLIKHLPKHIGNLTKLRRFTASYNSLSKLPGSIIKLNLDNLDLFGNPFDADENDVVFTEETFRKITSLQDLSARVIRKNEIFYDNYEVVPWFLIRYIDNGTICKCKKYCFSFYLTYTKEFDLRHICVSLINLDENERTTAPMEGVVCSKKCLKTYC